MKRTITLTLVVSPEDEMVEETVHDGDDEGRGETGAVEKTAESLAQIRKHELGVLISLGLKNIIEARTFMVLR